MKTRLLLLAVALVLPLPCIASTQTIISGPLGSDEFGQAVTVLPNGNYVVIDADYDRPNPPMSNVGAVYLYSPQGGLISALVGSQVTDFVGNGGITVLANGHFVVRSHGWNNGAAAAAGAVTWGDAETGWGVGKTVAVSAANSLVGTQTNDQVGLGPTLALSNGHYVVRSDTWRNGAVNGAGAVTWCDGAGGTVGPVSPANSLVGSQLNDQVGNAPVTALTNGNYVVRSFNWRNGAVFGAGAVTWGNGQGGTVGPVTPANSLVGSQAFDGVGSELITALSNGNYVVRSPSWDNGAVANAGAVTWCHGQGGTVGLITPANSLVGSQSNDRVGFIATVPLSNGHYVALSPFWSNGAVASAGAATWCNGQGGTVGLITPDNSLVGSQANDFVGEKAAALTNGHYVVGSSFWTNGAVISAGAVTWCNGGGGTVGPVTEANSLVGTQTSDQVGSSGIIALVNGNYVVSSLLWDNGTVAGAGAVTWGNGAGTTTGPVTPANSLVGSQANDGVGNGGIVPLHNGNYAVGSPLWDNGAVTNAGAATWGNGKTGTRGVVSPANSLVGSQPLDGISSQGIAALSNGHYVVCSQHCDGGLAPNSGAATWCNGQGGTVGPVTSANSLVGSQAGDQVGIGFSTLSNGNYVIRSPVWNNGVAIAAGAVTLGNSAGGTVGPVTPANSLVGSQANDNVGSTVSVHSDGYYLVRSPSWDNGATPNVGAYTLGDGQTGTVGQVGAGNSALGSVAGGGFFAPVTYDPKRQRLLAGYPPGNQVLISSLPRPHSVAKLGQDAPGAVDIGFGAAGALAVDGAGEVLFEAAVTGSGAKSGKRGLFAPGAGGLTELVLRQGDALSALGFGLPANATVAILRGPLRQGSLGGLFQATVKGAGVKATDNRLLLLDAPGGVRALLRSGQGMMALGGASLNRTLEVAQSHDQDVIALTYVLNNGGLTAVTGKSDTGLLLLRHDGTPLSGGASAQEGATAFGGGGNFRQFSGQVAAGMGNTVHFGALFQPAGGKAVPALFRTTVDGVTKARTATLGDTAPGAGGATFASFRGLSQQGAHALFTATLKGSSPATNEGLWHGDGSPVLVRKGDNFPGVTLSRILRFWPAGGSQVLLQVQFSDKSQALLLRQTNATYLTLLRTGQPAPGVGSAKLKTLSAVDVNPVTGQYVALGTLSGAAASANQALWSGDPSLGNDTTQTVYRLPVLRLRKGQTYRTVSTPQSVLRAIVLRPAVDKSGAGGRGLAQAVGSSGAIALILTGDRKLAEVVVLK